MSTELVDELSAKRVEHTVVLPRRTQSAAAEARAVGVTPGEVAKTVVVVTDEGYVRAVLPASERLDLRKLHEILRVKTVPRLATEAELGAAYPAFELGAVPPFGGPGGDRVVIDARLALEEEVVFEAATHSRSIKLRPRDLIQLTSAQVADISAA